MPFLLGLGAGVVLVPVSVWAGVALGAVDRPGPLRIHPRPVSLLGGPAVVGSAFVGILAAGAVPPLGVYLAMVVALVVGLADDLRPLPVWLRLLGQAAAGGMLVVAGLRLPPFGPLAEVAVVLLIVVMANAVNIVDGQDGLAGGLALIGAAGLVVVLGVEDAAAALGLALGGGLMAFLVWNWPPARVFLGNGGAYAVGVALAVLVAAAVAREGWSGLLAALLCLGMFAFELVFTVVRRVRARSPITAGDRLHSYDLLAERAGGRTISTLAFWGGGAACAAAGVLVDAVL